MNEKAVNTGSLVAGILLVLFGALALMGQLVPGFDFWSDYWPFTIIGIGLLFFAGMFAGGESSAPLAIPASIITGIGLLLFLQNLTGHWESWAYAWTTILFSVGFGIFLMGSRRSVDSQRTSGVSLMKIGTVMFLIFGAFFEMIFNSSDLAQIAFPIGLILLGSYLLIIRSGLLSSSGANNK
ncbi:MAG: hypothetical protein DWG76_03930 [Chloroflexi bacterium]|nr:hypothetical protein [Chloroflexota bacterium]